MTTEVVITEGDSKRNSDYSLQLNRWFLKPIGAWPSSPSTTRLEKIVSLILNVVCFSTLILTAIPSLLVIILEDETFNFKLKTFGFVNHWFVSSFNYAVLLMHNKDIRKCVSYIEADWRTVTREEDQNVMLKNARIGRYIAAFTAIFVQSSVLCFCFVTALNTVEIRIANETRVLHVLPCAVYKKLVNVDEIPTNEFMLFLQIWSTVIANFSTIGIFSLAAVLTAHACGQLNVITLWIAEFVNETRVEKKTGGFIQIGVIVERHLRTLNFISYIEDVMNKICLLEMLRCTMDICVIGYYILSCKKIGEVVYMTNWYYLPGKTILDLIMVIARSNLVVHITAGKLVHMSVYTFGSVIKTGFAYLNLLQQMM
ncbi:uncharacterized protein LOC126869031 isoform X2 [Bombus huntii]|uniref:uncharacterized protein LOC126869031 isoform X2 n=1 Tax=Bombus huntii TaxID=85661 RepID=UPI0021A9E0C7|nr:uncharacterized protein LOC126869031 isoform X2 [Bombus huntii]